LVSDIPPKDGKIGNNFYSVYSPADQRIFPYHLMFVDLEQLFPVQLEEVLYVLLLISEDFLIT
jgi:hypothetical protein